MNSVDDKRRLILKLAAATGVFLLPPALRATEPTVQELGDGSLYLLSDGYLSLSLNFLANNPEIAQEAVEILGVADLSSIEHKPPCNITLWRTQDRLVLFDVGSGSQFLDTVGLLPSQFDELGIDPQEVTDVVFTHAHPDHLWGLVDDFDELMCPDATYHMHHSEFDFWMSEDTLNSAPENQLGMVAGARNRLPLIDAQLQRFEWGDEIVPGVEAIDTHGHTPGHTSFAIHQGSQSVVVIGDAVTHEVLSFQKPDWAWPTDQDPEAAALSRRTLLDRLAADQTPVVAYHLSTPGLGRVESNGTAFKFSAGTL
ncbi:MAG: MBL fold metallo-hydrolase [Gammaproteobacteria bacterium]|nr:MBL fold metallo-hydrolase [Gammaproteobacteria bacterium]